MHRTRARAARTRTRTPGSLLESGRGNASRDASGFFFRTAHVVEFDMQFYLWDNLSLNSRRPTIQHERIRTLGDSLGQRSRTHQHTLLGLSAGDEALAASVAGAARGGRLRGDGGRPGSRGAASCGLVRIGVGNGLSRLSRGEESASATQVRKSLYTSSVGRWKNHESFLGSLFANLPSNELQNDCGERRE